VLANAHPLTPEAYERIQALRREVYDSDDYREAIRAFIEKRDPVFARKIMELIWTIKGGLNCVHQTFSAVRLGNYIGDADFARLFGGLRSVTEYREQN
jgi:hypothetical protein